MDVHIYIYIYRVYINVIIPKVWLKNLPLAEMYTTPLMGLWSLPTQINQIWSQTPWQDVCQEWWPNKPNHVCKAP